MATVLDTLVTKLSFIVEGTPLESLFGTVKKDTVAIDEMGTASVEASRKIKQVTVATKEAGVAAEFFGEQMKHVSSAIKDFVGLFLGIEVISKSVEAFNDMSTSMAQIQTALKSTGDAAGFTSEQFEDMAEKLQDTSRYDKADILKGVTTTLLRFTTIHGETFARAQQDIVDYAARSGQNLSEASLQIGKALDDPTKAMGVLHRAGITLTDDQQKMIEAMAKSGDAAGAQAKILDLLETRFKGAAQAAADTGTGPLIVFGNKLKDIAEIIGKLIVNALDPLVIKLGVFVDFLKEHATATTVFIAILGSLILALIGVKTALTLAKIAGEAYAAVETVIIGLTKIWAAIQALLDAELVILILEMIELAAVAAVVALAIQDLWVYFHGGDSVIGRLIDRFEAFIEKHQELKAILGVVGAIFKLVWSAIKLDFEVTVKFIEDLIDSLIGEFKMVSDFFSDLSDQITGVVGKITGLGGATSAQNGVQGDTSVGKKGFLASLTDNINAATAWVVGNTPQGNSVTNNSHAPVTNVNLTVNANSADGDHIGKQVIHHLTNHYKNAARAYDSGIAS